MQCLRVTVGNKDEVGQTIVACTSDSFSREKRENITHAVGNCRTYIQQVQIQPLFYTWYDSLTMLRTSITLVNNRTLRTMDRKCKTSTRLNTDAGILPACHFIPIAGLGKERRILIGPWGSAKAALVVRNYLEVHWPCTGGLSAVNAIGTQLRDPINAGLTRWRMAV